MGPTCVSLGSHLVPTWVPLGSQFGPKWSHLGPNGIPVVLCWVPLDSHLGPILVPRGLMLVLYWVQLGPTWVLIDSHLGPTWVTPGSNLGPIWFPFGYLLGHSWVPVVSQNILSRPEKACLILGAVTRCTRPCIPQSTPISAKGILGVVLGERQSVSRDSRVAVVLRNVPIFTSEGDLLHLTTGWVGAPITTGQESGCHCHSLAQR